MTNIIEARDYEIVKNLGQGTFGTVYLCNNDRYEKCCVKTIQIREQNEFRQYNHLELVKREVYILLNLKHPRILTMYEYFRSENFVFIVTEYLSNGTLAELISQYDREGKKFFEKEILNYFCDILIGLEYLRLKDVVHGDLKSENILIDCNGRIKIADFGVSKCVNQPVNSDTLCLSTPLYTPPEALFDITKYSFASDIWSLGCIFYELCMLHHPFHRAYTVNELYDVSSRSIYQTIDYERKNYSRDILKLSNMMLEPKVERRGTIKTIVKQPIVQRIYYEKYFDFDDSLA